MTSGAIILAWLALASLVGMMGKRLTDFVNGKGRKNNDNS